MRRVSAAVLVIPILFTPLMLQSSAVAQVSSPLQEIQPLQDDIIEGPTIFSDVENFGHPSGYSIFVPQNWTIDTRLGTEEGRLTKPMFTDNDLYNYEKAAVLCGFSPGETIEYNKVFRCETTFAIVHPDNILGNVEVLMYDPEKCNCEDPLDYHLEVLTERYPQFATMGLTVLNVTDVTINYTDPNTNQTIQQLPGKRADIMGLIPASAAATQGLDEYERVFINSILYTVVDFGEPSSIGFARDIYMISNLKQLSREMGVNPETLSEGQDSLVLDATLQEIFDSFKILAK